MDYMTLNELIEKLLELKEKGYGDFKMCTEEYTVCDIEVSDVKNIITIQGYY